MNPESPFSGPPRQWYMAPLFLGITLIILSILIVKFPMLLVYTIAIPIFLAGVASALVGLDLWRGAKVWRERLQSMRWRR